MKTILQMIYSVYMLHICDKRGMIFYLLNWNIKATKNLNVDENTWWWLNKLRNKQYSDEITQRWLYKLKNKQL